MLNVVTGLSRSGTSMMSYMVQDQVGGRFIGDRMPNVTRLLNPEIHNRYGFWESKHLTFKGTEDQFYRHNDRWAKVIIKGLMACDASIIGDVILMVRDPRISAASRVVMGMRAVRVITPSYYCRVISRFGAWVTKHGMADKITVFDYADLIEDPSLVSRYQGLTLDPNLIDPTQNRSRPIEDGRDWSPAMETFELVKAGDWSKLAMDSAVKYYVPPRGSRGRADR